MTLFSQCFNLSFLQSGKMVLTGSQKAGNRFSIQFPMNFERRDKANHDSVLADPRDDNPRVVFSWTSTRSISDQPGADKTKRGKAHFVSLDRLILPTIYSSSML